MSSSWQEEGAPSQPFQWARRFIPKRLQPYLRGLRKRYNLRGKILDEPYKTVFTYTQVSRARQENLVRLVKQIEEMGLPGDLVECGVLDGGTSALLAHASSESKRRVHLFDAWEGLPEVTEEDGEGGSKWVGQVVGSPRRVRSVMSKLSINPERIIIHRGWFEDTFSEAKINTVALLHVDCDFYAATQLCLKQWYPILIPGGFVQFDDYDAFKGCRQAVDEFLGLHPAIDLQTYGDRGVAYYIRKPVE